MRQAARLGAVHAAAGGAAPVMTDSVTDIIVSRSKRQERLTLMIVGSALAHGAVLLLVLFLPSSSGDKPVREVMTISLGGPEGPRTGGLTEIGGRPVQEVAPPPPKPVETRAAPVPPKMTVPEPKSRPAPKPRQAPAEAASRTVTTGERVIEGTTPVDTGARGTGFGLSSGGAGLGGELQLDVTDFCCTEYLDVIIASIKRNWRKDQGRPGSTVIKFTISRNGAINSVSVDRPSDYYPFNAEAQRAVQLAQLPPLPAAFPNQTLTVLMTFKYY